MPFNLTLSCSVAGEVMPKSPINTCTMQSSEWNMTVLIPYSSVVQSNGHWEMITRSPVAQEYMLKWTKGAHASRVKN